jgi:hypothetical protein
MIFDWAAHWTRRKELTIQKRALTMQTELKNVLYNLNEEFKMSSIIPGLVDFCKEEWQFFKRGEINLNGTCRDGLKEYEDGAWQRIADYWKFIGGPFKNLTGKDRGVPWSAAFISFCFKEAGAGKRFPYSSGHATYINEAIRNNSTTGKRHICAHDLKGKSLEVGDLIGYWRGSTKITLKNALKIGWYQSHTDIVIEIGDGYAYAIGAIFDTP